ncbi:amino acid adenylation domain-containing protein [Dactylosporangium sp. NPDC048998]|uniref:amino acid adenylation domain-containing protein n=1 Tax=Dactylosporangium sp. NPDC048998 TaxID=3363976 RepID=UPI00371AB66F
MTTPPFSLPRAWRDDAFPGPREAAVVHAVPDRAVALAVHLAVLSALTDDAEIRTTIRVDGRARDVRAEPGRRGRWPESVARARSVLDAAGEPVGEPAPGQVLFTDAAATGYALVVELHAGGLTLRAYHGALAGDRLELLAEMYRAALADATGDGPAVVAVPPDEWSALRRWGTGPVVDRGATTFVDLWEAQAARTPDTTAVRVDGGTLTYRELSHRARQFARHLGELRTDPDAPVGVSLRRTADLLPVLLGTWLAGAAYLPLDVDLPPARRREMIDSAGCGVIVTTTDQLAALTDAGSRTFCLMDKERELIAERSAGPLPGRSDPDALAYLMYTSGSTGKPKAVMVQHRGLVNYLLWAAEAYLARGAGGSPYFTSISFDLGVPSLFGPLLVGQAVDLLPDPLDVADLGRLLASGAPYSFVKMTPGHLNLLALDLEPAEAHVLAGLVIAAGDAFPVELAARWAALAGPGGTPVATEYGPTEITVGNSGQTVDHSQWTGLIPLGDPIANTTMYVLNARSEPVPAGVPGEVYVGGTGVAAGYLGAPALTADRFVPDPWGPPGARMYRTGDRGRWQAGALEFLGRIDGQRKIRGHRVELGEVAAAVRRHPDVADAVVIVHERPARPARLAAFVVLVAQRVLDARALRAALAEELPEYMIPTDIRAVADVPLTANGKIDNRRLESLLTDPQGGNP